MGQDDLLTELKRTFLDELGDILEYMEEAFMRLEKNHSDKDCINELFRLFHNAKGSGKTVGLTELSHCAHAAENILTELRSGTLTPTPQMIDALILTVDYMRKYQQQARDDINAPTHDLTSHSETLEIILKNPGEVAQAEPQVKSNDTPKSPQTTTPKVARNSQDPLPAIQTEIKGASSKNNDEFIKIPLRRIDELLDLFGEQVILQSSLDHILSGDISQQQEFIRKTAISLKKITQDLQHTMVSLRMVSIKPLFNRMERTIRDISKMTEKEIEFIKKGESAELDKTIVDALIDPLTHMIRNAVDHGIESKEERLAKGKKPIGQVSLIAQRNGGSFDIIVEDDGGGLDRDRILKKAQELGFISGGDGENLSDSKIFSFIFASGFSTREEVTEVSGRGVGMDVVNQKILDLKGNCTILSSKDVGTRFTIRLPLSLAMFNGTIVTVGNEKYVVPNSDFNEAIAIKDEEFREDENLIKINDRIIKMLDLKNVLESKKFNIPHLQEAESLQDKDSLHNSKIKRKKKRKKKKLALITRYEQDEYALLVNDIISQEQIVLKQLGPEFRQVKASSGGTILGDGQVALVLDLNSVVKYNIK